MGWHRCLPAAPCADAERRTPRRKRTRHRRRQPPPPLFFFLSTPSAGTDTTPLPTLSVYVRVLAGMWHLPSNLMYLPRTSAPFPRGFLLLLCSIDHQITVQFAGPASPVVNPHTPPPQHWSCRDLRSFQCRLTALLFHSFPPPQIPPAVDGIGNADRVLPQD